MSGEPLCGCTVCMIFSCIIVSVILFLPALVFLITSEEDAYHKVNTIQDLGGNEYIMGLQCRQSYISEFIFSCDIENFTSTEKQKCEKNSKKLYGLYQFTCANQTYITSCFENQGGKYHKRNEGQYILSLIFFSVGGCFLLCVISGWMTIAIITLVGKLYDTYN